ncbi:dnaJ homolog subfamily C member 16-like isoform X2 [Limulus polyphemus]|uniref:DnaJ homolog subfamily C member 16 n=1 Tax=Limulus polyphemus TaxID=6850 RepID=A0ABM1B585_LIMPO|nr:dnaJ homolog subfamily C member 16-like isoform X2 [Limulus polyphemus]
MHDLKFQCSNEFLIFIISIILVVQGLRDPYKTLGVKSSASVQEIKQAYKRLVRQWHPDKNEEPGTESRFIEINKAYELLMDPERKQLFDRQGTIEDIPNFRRRPDYSQIHRFEFDPFDSFFNHGEFKFTFDEGSIYHKYTITSRAYENHIIPASTIRPYLIFFYDQLCAPCIHTEPIWQKIASELEPIGVGLAAIHMQNEPALAKKLGVNSLPYLIGVIDGRHIHYKNDLLSFRKIIEFTRKLFPYKTVVNVKDNSLEKFLNGWSDNKVRALFFSQVEPPRLRYLLLAYQYNTHASFGFIKLGSPGIDETCRHYGVNKQMDSLLVFNENVTSPVATLSMGELAPQTMRDVLEANKFLLLPRLSSQHLFDQLCPPEAAKSRKQLCVILITQNTQTHDPYRAVMRDFIQYSTYPREKVRFMFIFKEKQEEFVNALSTGEGAPEKPDLHVVILWRQEFDKVRYQWLEAKWSIKPDAMNNTKKKLEENLQQLIQTTEGLPYHAKVASLSDEQARGLFSRIVNRLIIMGDVLRDNISRQEVLPAISVVLSVAFIIIVGYVMSYLVQLEEQNIQEKYRREGKQPPGVCGKSREEHKLNIHELRGETYNGLVRLLKPGFRTIVLLVDKESKSKLLPKFYKIVYPYRKNKSLMFAFLMVEKNLDWYRRILLQTLGESRELNINPKNCIGTVLSLNGHRKYFCVYHAKHAEPRKGHSSFKQSKKVDGISGDFMGFEESYSESESSDIEAGGFLKREDDDVESYNILFQEHLLDRLSNWLDRLFEGTTQRYYIQYWPENMK